MEIKPQFLAVFLGIVLVMATFSAVAASFGVPTETDIVLVSLGGENDVSRIESAGGEILETYPDKALIEIPEMGERDLRAKGIDISSTLPARTELSVKGHQFDINEGMPDFPEELTIDSYESGEEGLYLVNMIGPVHAEWRARLESRGIEIINYVPNYGYEVRMTPEWAERVEDLEFVEWVDIYQPGFKLAEDVEPGMISVTFADGERSIINVRSENQLVELANRNDVYYISQFIEPELNDEMATQTIGGGLWIWDPEDDPDSAYRGHGDYGSLATQLGHDGDGVVVAVADTGLGDGTTYDAGHPDFDGRVIGGYDYESESFEEGEWDDGHGHGTHCSGSAAGHTHGGTGETVYEDYYAAEGTAPGSDLFAVKIFDDGGSWIAGDDYHEIVEIPKQAEDAYIHSNSWGSSADGAYTESSEDFDRAVRDANRDSDENEPMTITVSAGNDGPGAFQGGGYNSIGAPATAKNVITVGSTENYPEGNPEAVSSFSSRGWTDDNRVKPDVMAPGEDIYSTQPDGGYDYMSGTSMSNPAVAGAAASIVDWYESTYGEKPHPSMIRALMINTAYDLANEQSDTGENSPYIPNQDEGWGMVNLPNIVHTDVNMLLENEDSLIETGEVHEYEIEQDDGTEPLRMSLTWTDAAAAAGDEWTLKNDLNLEVESPSGEIYRGNNLVESWSVPGEDTYDTFDTNDDGWDDVNNVENVYLLPEDVEDGTYTVRVIGYNVPSDANNDGDANQDYSLVKWNAVDSEAEPGPLSPSDPNPADGETGVPTDVELSVYVEHESGDSMDVSFYDASDDSLIGEDSNVASGSRAYTMWEDLDYETEYEWYTVADDGDQTATSDTWGFVTEEDEEEEPGEPLAPTDPDPQDGETGVPTDVELSVYVEHESGDSMDVSFYDASDDSLIGEDSNVASGSRAYTMWEDLDYDTEYEWYTVADDGDQTATSDTWSFITEEDEEEEPGEPLAPTDPDPQDGETGVPTDAELSVYVEHEDEENMDVSFYDASDNLIGTDSNVASGSRAYTMWEDLDYETEYEWYTVADDGDQTATSDTWSFVTEEDDDDETTPPVIEKFEVEDTSNPQWARVEVDWEVFDDDGDLETVELEMIDSDGNVVDSETNSVSGESASGTDELRDRRGSGEYEIVLTVTDTDGNTTTETKTIEL